MAPNLNHYRVKLLNELYRSGLQFHVIAGSSLSQLGHEDSAEEFLFPITRVDANKYNFVLNIGVYLTLINTIRQTKPVQVLMPLERKFLPLIIYLTILKHLFRFSLISYNHASYNRKLRKYTWYHNTFQKALFSLYDRVIFYTEKSMARVVKMGLIAPDKAYYANNTIDTATIWQSYEFEVNFNEPKNLLFIGRLVQNKNCELLIKYFSALRRILPGTTLTIIGDGPEREFIKNAIAYDSDITWLGSIVDEKQISTHMRNAHVVFVPGASGLSIVHAFCYGKPYVTLRNCVSHGPELDYLQSGKNGVLLEGGIDNDVYVLSQLLQDQVRYESMCNEAYRTAQALSIDDWCRQIKVAIQN